MATSGVCKTVLCRYRPDQRIGPLDFFCFADATQVPMFLTAPFLHYYNTRSNHLKREFLPHLLWTVAQLSGTVGCFVIMGGPVAIPVFAFTGTTGRVYHSTISIKAVVDTNKLSVPTLNPKSAYENTSYIGGSYSLNIWHFTLLELVPLGGF